LTVLPLLGDEERLLDIGSGGGFPGIPLKIARPGLKIVSIDSVQKKIAFQRHVSRMLGLTDFEPLPLRAEAVPGSLAYGGGFDVVVSRAFSSLAAFASLARPCMAPGGKIIAMKGEEGGREVAGARAELDAMGLICATVHSRKLPASGAARMLIVLEEKKGHALKDISAPEVLP
jgi:16S rRNA (guanine527-N7)-methyltransferase